MRMSNDIDFSRVFDERTSSDATYPSTLPSVGDSPEHDELARILLNKDRQDSPMRYSSDAEEGKDDDLNKTIRTSFAPPGYVLFELLDWTGRSANCKCVGRATSA